MWNSNDSAQIARTLTSDKELAQQSWSHATTSTVPRESKNDCVIFYQSLTTECKHFGGIIVLKICPSIHSLDLSSPTTYLGPILRLSHDRLKVESTTSVFQKQRSYILPQTSMLIASSTTCQMRNIKTHALILHLCIYWIPFFTPAAPPYFLAARWACMTDTVFGPPSTASSK